MPRFRIAGAWVFRRCDPTKDTLPSIAAGWLFLLAMVAWIIGFTLLAGKISELVIPALAIKV